MDMKTIQMKAINIYETYSSKETDDNQGEDENQISEPQSASSGHTKTKKQFSASICWFWTFIKRYNLNGAFLRRYKALNEKILGENHVNVMNDSGHERKPERVSNMNEIGILQSRLLSRLLTIEDNTMGYGLKIFKERVSYLGLGNAAGTLSKPH